MEPARNLAAGAPGSTDPALHKALILLKL
jgi:hypothetical protein